ncbi:hypothetical protein J437_LFUL003292 [Ladona fulva]|uniref:PH domain-containing protein n=1 Tax=Ladona fulva TaxID=123851 RepID=A0A8K0KNJ0_LADFU|nr:hypothetical protein J437_LFUL003292 [Ladona fulva]
MYMYASNCVEEKEWIDILTKICQTNSNRLKLYHPSAFVDGRWLCVMIKRAQGRKKFGRKNFKRRYFRLTTQDLAYSKTSDSLCSPASREPLCVIPLEDILAVERLQEDSFKMKNMFQIVQPKRALYVQVICKEAKVNAPGCREVSQGLNDDNLFEGQRDLDPERQLERIRSLLDCGKSRLQAMATACRCKLNISEVKEKSDEEEHYQLSETWTVSIEDPRSCLQMVEKLLEAIASLNEHRRYLQSISQEKAYGSKHAPIGDDNYLILAGQSGSSFETHYSKKTVCLTRSCD